jgi:hypothetical protein
MPAQVHVSRRLTDVSIHYPWDFTSVGERFFPRRPTEHLTDQFAYANKANLLRLEELSPLGDDDVPPEIELVWDADKKFSCRVYGVSSPGKWITEKNADPSLDYETERTIQLTTSLRLRLEYLRYVQRLRSTTYMTSNSTLTGAQRFDNYASGSSAPIETMQFIVNNIAYANQGKRPNRIAATTFAWQAILNSEDFRDRVKFNDAPSLHVPSMNEDVSGYLGAIEKLIGVAPGTIIISDATYNVAAASQTPVYTTFAGPDMVFGFVEDLGLRKYSLSAGFQWSAYSSDPQAIISVPQYNQGTMPTDQLRAFTVIDPFIIEPTLGYLLKGVISTTQDSNGNSYGDLVAH